MKYLVRLIFGTPIACIVTFIGCFINCSIKFKQDFCTVMKYWFRDLKEDL